MYVLKNELNKCTYLKETFFQIHTVRPRFYHRFRQRRNSDKIGVSDKIDGTWNKRKPPFFKLCMYFFV